MVKEVGLYHIGALKPFEKYSPICYQNNNWWIITPYRRMFTTQKSK